MIAISIPIRHALRAMMLVADNLHILNPSVSRALTQMDPQPVERMVEACCRAGAQAIDINPGPLRREPEKYFRWLVEVVQAVTNRPLVLDTPNPAALEAGLRVCRNAVIINGFSLEAAKRDHILPLAKKYGAPIVGYLLGPKSQVPLDEEEMMSTAVELFDAFSATGMDSQQLIIDPVITPLTWESGIRHNRAVLSVIQQLAALLGGPVRTIAGISNLASGPVDVTRKIELEQAFLPMLAAAGLDFALLNIFHGPTVRTAIRCDTLLGDKVFAW